MPFSPFVPLDAPNGQSGSSTADRSSQREREEEDYDHHDQTKMDDLREEVRGELVKAGLGEGPSIQPGTMAGGGIADEDGLGWPGQLTLHVDVVIS